MIKLFSKTRSKTDYDRIQKLISMAAESEAAEVEIEADGVRVVVRKYASPPVSQTEAPASGTVVSQPTPPSSSTDPEPQVGAVPDPDPQPANVTHILSPTPGTFYTRPAPDADPFVQIGDHISEGQTVCIIEAMKLMNEVEAEITGTVLKILVNDGDGVEYDQPLIVIEPA